MLRAACQQSWSRGAVGWKVRLLLAEDRDGIDMVDRSVRRALTAAIASSSSTSWSRASGEKATRQMKLAQRDDPRHLSSDARTSATESVWRRRQARLDGSSSSANQTLSTMMTCTPEFLACVKEAIGMFGNTSS